MGASNSHLHGGTLYRPPRPQPVYGMIAKQGKEARKMQQMRQKLLIAAQAQEKIKKMMNLLTEAQREMQPRTEAGFHEAIQKLIKVNEMIPKAKAYIQKSPKSKKAGMEKTLAFVESKYNALSKGLASMNIQSDNLNDLLALLRV